MSYEIRIPREDERELVARAAASSFNKPHESLVPRVPLEQMVCAFDDGAVVATAGGFPFLHWFGGKPVATSGVFLVTTLPEHRGRGLMRDVMRMTMDVAHDRGDPLTSLFPAALGPYRSLGYEVAGSITKMRLPLESIPRDDGDLPIVEPVDLDRDLAGIRSCWRAFIRDVSSGIEPTDDAWWRTWVFHPKIDDHLRAVAVRERDAITGFASFRPEPVAGHLPGTNYGMSCIAFAYTTHGALRALLAYFRGHRSLGAWVQWAAPTHDPVALLVPEADLQIGWRFPWMLRPLNVPAALQQRGYPPIDAEVVVSVDDPLYPANAGPWRLTVKNGEASVEPTDDASTRPIDVRSLASMYSGYLRVPDAVRLGVLDAGPTADALGELFAGSDPWLGLFF